MGGAPLLVVVIAVGIGLLASLLLFGVGPASIRSVFFSQNGHWRRFGRVGLLCAIAAMLLLAFLATPTHAP